ncbi:hypothetical protein [Amycolatopsis sp. cg9]|uniref:effector-associated constant component EACC1 n=1 Tax=Amycolatopsis sp. cg9 TaxID=3238801 RepID=UPI003525642B
MELTISAGSDEQALEQFYDWLREDVDVVRSASISTAGGADSGRMGAFEVICMSISSLTGLASLSVAWASFRRSRNATPPVTFTIASPLTDEQLAFLKSLDLPWESDAAGEDE